MSRVEIPFVVQDTSGNALVSTASITVNVRGGGTATVFAAETGGTTLANPLTSSAVGGIDGWLDEGSYNLVVSGPGITTYTQPFDAVRGDGVGRYAAGSITLAALASAVAQTLIPTGAMLPYAGGSVPTGFLLCDGSSILRTAQPTLFTSIGTTWGSVDGTHFTLPDTRGRTLIGDGTGTAAGATAHTLGQMPTTGNGGEETHTLSISEIPSHNHGGSTGTGTTGSESSHTHTISDPSHAHTSSTQASQLLAPASAASGAHWAYAEGAVSVADIDIVAGITTTNSTGITGTNAGSAHTHTVPALTIASNGSGSTHNNMQPTATVKYIIKT